MKKLLYHLPFWFMYHYLSWSLIVGSLVEPAASIFTEPAAKFYFYVLFQAAGVYLNLYVLMPRLLEKGRYVLYLILLVPATLGTTALIVPGYYAEAYLSGHPLPTGYWVIYRNKALPSTMASMTLAMSLKFAKNWLQSRHAQQVLEKEKLASELKFLRAQLNPHFLFNTINSIFVLINKDPALASDALLTFSGLMRYQLYECNGPFIPLPQETGYLHNFIELEKLRHDLDLQLTVDISTQANGHLSIAPFLLLPFVENAFKHVSAPHGESTWISLKTGCTDGTFTLEVVNSTNGHRSINTAGIGLQNVRRRLELLYPGRYQLDIRDNAPVFRVTLKLQLHETPLRNH